MPVTGAALDRADFEFHGKRAARPTIGQVGFDVVAIQQLQRVKRRTLNVDKVTLNIGIAPWSVHHKDVCDHQLAGLDLSFRVEGRCFQSMLPAQASLRLSLLPEK